MAFQCEDCYKNKEAFMYLSLSRGPCENCHYTDVCVDMPFNIDPNWRSNVIKTLKKNRLPMPEWYKEINVSS